MVTLSLCLSLEGLIILFQAVVFRTGGPPARPGGSSGAAPPEPLLAAAPGSLAGPAPPEPWGGCEACGLLARPSCALPSSTSGWLFRRWRRFLRRLGGVCGV